MTLLIQNQNILKHALSTLLLSVLIYQRLLAVKPGAKYRIYHGRVDQSKQKMEL